MRILERGHRVAYEPAAVAYEEAQEMEGFSRRVRITAGNIEQLREIKACSAAPAFCPVLPALAQDRASAGARVHAHGARREYRAARAIPLQLVAAWASALLRAGWAGRDGRPQTEGPPAPLLLLHDQLGVVCLGLPGCASRPRHPIAGRARSAGKSATPRLERIQSCRAHRTTAELRSAGRTRVSALHERAIAMLAPRKYSAYLSVRIAE